MEKIKLITHDDLDGLGCAIVTRALNPYCDLDVTHCSNDNVNETVKRFIDMAYDYTTLMITDLSVNEEVAKQLDDLHRERKVHVVLLDHHKTALWLNDQYEWAKVKVTDINQFGIECKTCGTQLTFRHFVGFNDMSYKGIKLSLLVEMIRSYDTWDWNINKYSKPKKLNDLFKILGWDRFLEKMHKYINCNDVNFLLDDKDMYMLEIEQERINRYIMKKHKQMDTICVKHADTEYVCGVVFADSYVSELGNELCKTYPSMDVAIIVTDTNVSFRSVKDNVDVAELAKKFNGGGHKAAAGMPFDKGLFIKVLENELNK